MLFPGRSHDRHRHAAVPRGAAWIISARNLRPLPEQDGNPSGHTVRLEVEHGQAVHGEVA
jgi:hypothetical protein